MTGSQKRRPRGVEYVPITMRYTPSVLDGIRRYAADNGISLNMANERLITKGMNKEKAS